MDKFIQFVKENQILMIWLVSSVVVPVLRLWLKPAEGSLADKLIAKLEAVFLDITKLIGGNSARPSVPPGGVKK